MDTKELRRYDGAAVLFDYTGALGECFERGVVHQGKCYVQASASVDDDVLERGSVIVHIGQLVVPMAPIRSGRIEGMRKLRTAELTDREVDLQEAVEGGCVRPC